MLFLRFNSFIEIKSNSQFLIKVSLHLRALHVSKTYRDELYGTDPVGVFLLICFVFYFYIVQKRVADLDDTFQMHMIYVYRMFAILNTFYSR